MAWNTRKDYTPEDELSPGIVQDIVREELAWQKLQATQRGPVMSEHSDIPADWEALASASPDCLRGYAPGWAEVEVVQQLPGSITYRVRQEQLGGLGTVEIRKMRDRLSKITFANAPHDFAMTDEQRTARKRHFRKVRDVYFKKLGQENVYLTESRPTQAKTDHAPQNDEPAESLLYPLDRLCIEWATIGREQYRNQDEFLHKRAKALSGEDFISKDRFKKALRSAGKRGKIKKNATNYWISQ